MTFEDVLHPLTRKTFVSEYLGERWLRLEGTSSRFAHLAPWDAINGALSRDRFAGDRLQLAKNGRLIPAAEYLTKPHATSGTQIQAEGLVRHLRAGATLIMCNVDELLPNVRALVEDMSDLFRIDIGVNLYAGWKTDNGFNLHWDDHDTLVLQIAGRKHWRVYAPTTQHPLQTDAGKIARPTESPVWDGELHDGDLLYMPRGWWHVAYPENEPSLHLTIALGHHTGFDLLRWIARELKAEPMVRADLPHLADEQAQAAYVERLGELIQRRLSPDLVASFMRCSDRYMRTRPLVSLPDQVKQETTGLQPQSLLRLSVDRRLSVRANGQNGSVAFTAAGEEWSCEKSLAPGLNLLRGGRNVPMQTILDAVQPADRGSLRLMLAALATGGAIIITAAGAASRP